VHHDHGHSLIFVVLSYAVAALAGWTALDLARRIEGRSGRDRAVWLATAALSMGGGVWAMHFIAMLGFDPGAPISYDPLLTILSFMLAVAGTAVAFFASADLRLGRGRMPVAALAMGGAIAAMHYVGMSAMRTTAAVGWNPGLVLLSIAIAVAASGAALWVAGRRTRRWARAAAAGILGLAVVGMHYCGMAALRLQSSDAVLAPGSVSPLILAVCVASVTVVILFLTLAAAIADERTRLLDVIEAGGVGYWEISLKDRSISLSHRARQLLGLPAGQNTYAFDNPPWLRLENVGERSEALRAALAGEAPYDVEFRIGESDRWVQAYGSLVRSRSGRRIKLAGVIRDVTDRRRAFAELETSERRQQLLINELNHRVKNTLASIQSIAALTARRSETIEEFGDLFQARLMALSDTHNLLTATGWEKATLRDLLAKELRPYAVDQFVLEGPEVMLEPVQALAMGMIAHELVTNAAKHGALSAHGGRVTCGWSTPDPDGRVTLNWIETGGPKVVTPERRGFGSRLIATSLKGDLPGEADIDYAPGGLRVRMTFRTTAQNS
jgi:NO-binding membrane sensor protein with MHYT domain/two-component sensor histidine kinase